MNYSDDRSLWADLRDLQIFLERSCTGTPAIPLYVERHYGAAPREIAFVVVGLPDHALRRQVRALVEAGLRHLGYEIQNRGSDVFDVWPDPREASAHDIVRAVKRFEDLQGAGSGNDAADRKAGPKLTDRAPGGSSCPSDGADPGRDGVVPVRDKGIKTRDVEEATMRRSRPPGAAVRRRLRLRWCSSSRRVDQHLGLQREGETRRRPQFGQPFRKPSAKLVNAVPAPDEGIGPAGTEGIRR